MMENTWTLCAQKIERSSYLALKWISPEAERLPEEAKTAYPVNRGFFAAGKQYRNLQQMTTTQIGDYLYHDIYGRDVIALRERFPCFDSYDFLHENRYYRWFFIKEDGKLTRVYYADTRGVVQVTEDVRVLETRCLEEMKKLKWLE